MAGERESADQADVPGAGPKSEPDSGANGASASGSAGSGRDGLVSLGVELEGVVGTETDGPHACFSTLDVTRVRRALAKLHEQVAFGRGRVEIKKRGCDDVCVMISKAELEALESALEIMSATAEYKSMCDTLSEVAAATGGYAAARPCGPA